MIIKYPTFDLGVECSKNSRNPLLNHVPNIAISYWKANICGIGSDGWNRTTDLGVMNPDTASAVTYKNPQMG